MSIRATYTKRVDADAPLLMKRKRGGSQRDLETMTQGNYSPLSACSNVEGLAMIQLTFRIRVPQLDVGRNDAVLNRQNSFDETGKAS